MRNINEFNIPPGNSNGYEILYFGVNLVLMFDYRLSFDVQVKNSDGEIQVLIVSRKDVSKAKHASNTLPPGSKSASGDDVSGFAKLPRGQHYGQCEEVGRDNELGCDVINESDLPKGYKQGIADAKSEQFPSDDVTHRTGTYMDGYILGYCSVHHDAPINVGGRNCTLPLYPSN
ncbi:MAG: hypothetical protein WBQ25_09665 [Nitrososphaeraceae archaeon]